MEKFPPYIDKILAAFARRQRQAYLVGGGVRDLLLGRQPHDYDLATASLPEENAALCREEGWPCLDRLGARWGVLSVLVDGHWVELSTFRGERYALEDREEGHRPAAVWYGRTLAEDMARRDFTVNAMALDRDYRLYDYWGGREDLARRLLRPVGEAGQRYREDALRMLRACRFVAQLGFDYVQEGDQLPEGCGMAGSPYYLATTYRWPVEGLQGVSLARVRGELEGLLTAPYAGKGLMLLLASGLAAASCRLREGGGSRQVPLLPELCHLLGLPQNPRYHMYDVWEHTLQAIDNSPPELAVRWALLLHDLGKGQPGIRKPNKEGQPSDHGHEKESARLAAAILARLGYKKSFCQLVCFLVSRHMRFVPLLQSPAPDWGHWLRREVAERQEAPFRRTEEMAAAFRLLCQVFLADMGASCAGRDQAMMAKGSWLCQQVLAAVAALPVATADLALSGAEVEAVAGREAVGPILRSLLAQVQSGQLANTKEALGQAALKKAQRCRWKEDAAKS